MINEYLQDEIRAICPLLDDVTIGQLAARWERAFYSFVRGETHSGECGLPATGGEVTCTMCITMLESRQLRDAEALKRLQKRMEEVRDD